MLRNANVVRSSSALSGFAVPKNIAAGIGLPIIKTLEGQYGVRPIKEALRLPTNLTAAIRGWKTGANPSQVGGWSKYNYPARLIGAIDYAVKDIARRFGMTPQAAKYAILQNDTKLQAALDSIDPERAIILYHRTPAAGFTNSFEQGKRMLTGVRNPLENVSRGRENMVNALAFGSGAGAGEYTADDPLRRTAPVMGLGTAFWGPRGGLFALGGSTTLGNRAMQGMSPLPDWALPSLDPQGIKRFTGLSPGFLQYFRE